MTNADCVSSKTIKTAVIGLGRISWSDHIPEVLQHDNFELVGIVDPIQERVDETLEKFDIENGYLSCDELFKNQNLDLVVIASPTKFHLEQTLLAFENGCDVFCDKPIATSLDETDQMIAGMKKFGKKLMVFQPRRLDLDLLVAQKIISSGKLGKVYMVKRAVSAFSRRNDWQAFLKYGGGMLNNYGAHYIDQMLCLVNEKITETTCKLRTIASLGDADDVVKAIFTTESGIILDLDISQACSAPFIPWHILGEFGSAYFDQDSQSWHMKYYSPEDEEPLEIQDGLAAAGRQYVAESISWYEEEISLSDYELTSFYEKCHDYFGLNDDPFVPIEQTREIMRVIAECRKVAK